MNVTVVILTKNSEASLERCLRSVRWCQETIIVDDDSRDETLAIAKKFEARILRHQLNANFSAQRNYALQQAKGKWVFFLDSDEEVSVALREEIKSKITNQESEIRGYFIKRVDSMWGKKLMHGETGDIWLLRLAKKDMGKWEGKVHETWNVSGRNGKLQNPLDHFPHPTMQAFLQNINFYSTLRAQELHEQKVTVSLLDIILYPKGKFFVTYFLKRGFLDGIPGLLVAIVMSFHSFLVRGKLWQLQNVHR